MMVGKVITGKFRVIPRIDREILTIPSLHKSWSSTWNRPTAHSVHLSACLRC